MAKLINCLFSEVAPWYPRWFEKEGRFLEQLSKECVDLDHSNEYPCLAIKPKEIDDRLLRMHVDKFRRLHRSLSNGFDYSKPVMFSRHRFFEGTHRSSYCTARGIPFPACEVIELRGTNAFERWMSQTGEMLVDIAGLIHSPDESRYSELMSRWGLSDSSLQRHLNRFKDVANDTYDFERVARQLKIVDDKIIGNDYLIAFLLCQRIPIDARCSETQMVFRT